MINPFDLPGTPFLALYGALFVLTIIAGAIIPRWLRPEGRAQTVAEPEALALLSGGAPRFTDALIARLLAAGALIVAPNGLFAAGSDRGHTPAERDLLALPQPLKLAAADRALRPRARAVQDRLVAQGLMLDRSATTQLRIWQTSPYALLLLFGAIKWDVGVARDRPVGFLSALMIFTTIFALIRLFTVDARTRAGQAAVRAAQGRADRLRRAPTAPETGLAVALFGTGVLVGSGYAMLHTMRAPSGDSGGGDSGGGGDGGGGGGGCGGCGS